MNYKGLSIWGLGFIFLRICIELFLEQNLDIISIVVMFLFASILIKSIKDGKKNGKKEVDKNSKTH